MPKKNPKEVKSLLEVVGSLPSEVQRTLMLELAAQLDSGILEKVASDIHAMNCRRQRSLHPSSTTQWFTKADLDAFAPDKAALVNMCWGTLLTNGSRDGIIIETGSGKPWWSKFGTNTREYLAARVKTQSFIDRVDAYVAADHEGVGEKTETLLLGFADHLREKLYK